MSEIKSSVWWLEYLESIDHNTPLNYLYVRKLQGWMDSVWRRTTKIFFGKNCWWINDSQLKYYPKIVFLILNFQNYFKLFWLRIFYGCKIISSKIVFHQTFSSKNFWSKIVDDKIILLKHYLEIWFLKVWKISLKNFGRNSFPTTNFIKKF